MKNASDFFLSKDVMYLSKSLSFNRSSDIAIKDFYLLHITNVCYDEQAPKKEAKPLSFSITLFLSSTWALSSISNIKIL